jgi:hypothetical protein
MFIILLEQDPHTCEHPSSFRIVPTDGWRSLPFKHSLMLSSVMILQEQIIISHLLPIYYTRTGGEVNMPFNSTTINLILSALITAVLSGGYFFWKNSVEQESLNRLKVLQLEQQLKDQEKTITDLNVLNKESNELISDLKNKEINLNQKLGDLKAYLNNQPKDQKESSEVLKRTFKELSQ